MQRITTNKNLLYPEFSYKIAGLLFDVQNELGRFAREKQYADLLESKFEVENIKYEREFHIGDSGNIVDFLIGDKEKIILELKTVRFINREHYRQLQNYLQRAGIELGILVNFSDEPLRPRRVLRLDPRNSQKLADSDNSLIRT